MKKIKSLFNSTNIVFIYYKRMSGQNVAALESTTSASSVRVGQNSTGAVYVLDNSTGGNNFVLYNRSSNGEINAVGTWATGSNGCGDGLTVFGLLTNSVGMATE